MEIEELRDIIKKRIWQIEEMELERHETKLEELKEISVLRWVLEIIK